MSIGDANFKKTVQQLMQSQVVTPKQPTLTASIGQNSRTRQGYHTQSKGLTGSSATSDHAKKPAFKAQLPTQL